MLANDKLKKKKNLNLGKKTFSLGQKSNKQKTTLIGRGSLLQHEEYVNHKIHKHLTVQAEMSFLSWGGSNKARNKKTDAGESDEQVAQSES